MYAFIISQMGISVTGQEDSICVPSPVFYSWMIFTGTMILYIIWRIWLLVYSQMARQGEVREVQRQNNVAFDEFILRAVSGMKRKTIELFSVFETLRVVKFEESRWNVFVKKEIKFRKPIQILTPRIQKVREM